MTGQEQTEQSRCTCTEMGYGERDPQVDCPTHGTSSEQGSGVPLVGFMGSRQTVLDAIKVMGSSCCSYDLTWPEGRCDCKYGVQHGKWPSLATEQTGCPELRSLYAAITAMKDEEWALLTQRAGGTPAGLFAASAPDMERRLHMADAAARMAAEQIADVRRMLTLETEPTRS